MRRVVQHALAGVGATALVVAAGVSVLAGPAPATATGAAASAVTPSAAATPAPGPASAEPVGAGAGPGTGQQVDPASTEGERFRVALARIKAVDRRATALGTQGRAIVEEQARTKVALARAKAERAEARVRAASDKKAARAAARKAEAEADAVATARAKEVNARGYADGTTNPREIARQIMKNKYGYGAAQYSCFNYIIMRESGWDVNATNPSSGAYGIPQALPGSKMASVAADWRTNPATQIIWAIRYMNDRYGSPCQAKTFKAAHGWY